MALARIGVCQHRAFCRSGGGKLRFPVFELHITTANQFHAAWIEPMLLRKDPISETIGVVIR